jgi:hypothetical protein
MGGCVARKFGLWLSLVERCVRDAEAVGSNPTSPTFFIAVERGLLNPLMETDTATEAKQRRVFPKRIARPGVIYLHKSVFIPGPN